MKMHSRFRYMYDAAPASALRAKALPARTATANEAEKALDQLQGYWTTGELADATFAVVVNVDALDAVTGTYSIELEAGPVGFASSKVVGSLVGVTKTGQYVIPVDLETVLALKADTAAIRLKTVVTDTDGAGAGVPSIDYHAFLSPFRTA
jgi:hypothetical protein